MKLTDAEIVKALEMCNDKKGKCTDCPIYQHSARCISVLVENAIDLINRQKAEIERYKKVVGELTVSEDGEAVVLLDSHRTEYIYKPLHKTFMKQARRQARAEALQKLREKCNEHQDFHKGDDGVFKGWISTENLDRVIDDM